VSNITLPRAVAKRLRNVLRWYTHRFWSGDAGLEATRLRQDVDALEDALAEPPAKPEPVHPGYIIGSHWLETAYSRIAAGEAEADVLAEVLGERGWAKREPAKVEQIDEEYIGPVIDARWHDFEAGFRAAERFHGITKEDKT